MAKTKRSEDLMAIQETIARRIGSARELLVPNQSECARLLGVDASTLNKIEKGDRAPNVFIIIELSNILDVSTDFLLKGLVDPNSKNENATYQASQQAEFTLK